jgi:uncharacterized delta-60 repeat protein
MKCRPNKKGGFMRSMLFAVFTRCVARHGLEFRNRRSVDMRNHADARNSHRKKQWWPSARFVASRIALGASEVALAFAALLGHAATLDPTWGASSPLEPGKVVTPVSVNNPTISGTGNDQARAVVVQPDGKIVVAGGCNNTGSFDFCAVRYNADGSLDTTWAITSSLGAGKVITSITGGNDFANAAALQSDGKIVLVGTCFNASTGNDFCAVRYDTDGSLDATFNGSGIVITPVTTGYDEAVALAIQSDSKIVLAGYCTVITNFDFCAVRFSANGALDDGFNSTGVVLTPVTAGNDEARAVAVQTDGKIVLAGRCGISPNLDFCMVRYTANGALDSTFDVDGKVITSLTGGNDNALALAIQSDGKIVVAGNCPAGGTQFCTARYTTSGAPDTSFNGTGIVTTAVAGFSAATSIALQADGKLVLAGLCSDTGNNDFCALRYNADGSRDTSFNGSGAVISAVGSSSDEALAVALQADGKLVLGGACLNGSNYDFCAVRYDLSCLLDIDGSGNVQTAVDGMLFTRSILGYKGSGLIGGITFPTNATRSSPLSIEGYRSSCAAKPAPLCNGDIDNDGTQTAMIDGLIAIRAMLGITGGAALNGINFPAGATRTAWLDIRNHLVSECGLVLP